MLYFIVLIHSIQSTAKRRGVNQITIDKDAEIAAVLLKPEGMKNEYEIVTALMDVCDANNLDIVMDGHLLFPYGKAFAFYGGHRGKWFHKPMARQISGAKYCMVSKSEDRMQSRFCEIGSVQPIRPKPKVKRLKALGLSTAKAIWHYWQEPSRSLITPFTFLRQ